MHILVALLITIDDQVKVVAGLRDQCYELLSCTCDASEVIYQSQISVRGQGGVVPNPCPNICRNDCRLSSVSLKVSDPESASE